VACGEPTTEQIFFLQDCSHCSKPILEQGRSVRRKEGQREAVMD